MIKCPNCGSTAQIKYLKSKIEEDGEHIVVMRQYQCGCGKTFSTDQDYEAIYREEINPYVCW